MAKNVSSVQPRGCEGIKLFLVWGMVASAYAVLLLWRLANSPSLPWGQLLPFGAFSLALFFMWMILRRFSGRVDAGLFLITTFLSGLGVVMQFRMGTYADGMVSGTALALPLGFAAMIFVFLSASGGRWKRLSSVGWLCYAVAVMALLVMLVFGRRYRGGVYLPGNFNPTEIIKPLLVVFLASFLEGRKRDFSETVIGVPVPPARSFWFLAVLWAVPAALVFLLHDLGLLLLINSTLVFMLYAVGRKIVYLILGGVGVVASGALVRIASYHARLRFEAWNNPFNDPTGNGWQILQGLSAMNAGGIWGAGIGAGAPQSVPIVTSDYVYAAVAEELGIVACAFVLMAYACLLVRGWRVASSVKSQFGSVLAVGLVATIGMQVLLNVGGVTKALPLTGIVLPFLSQGGSSLVTTLAMVGLLGALSDRG